MRPSAKPREGENMRGRLERALAFLLLLPLAFALPSVSSADSGKPTTAEPLPEPSAPSGAFLQIGPGAAQATIGFFTAPSTPGGSPSTRCPRPRHHILRLGSLRVLPASLTALHERRHPLSLAHRPTFRRAGASNRRKPAGVVIANLMRTNRSEEGIRYRLPRLSTRCIRSLRICQRRRRHDACAARNLLKSSRWL